MKIIKKAGADLKTGKYHIIFSRILLICFVAGQYMVYAHQHKVVKSIGHSSFIPKNTRQQTVSEKCYLCDVMHHNAMVTNVQVYLNAVTVVGHVFKNVAYSFTSIQLILSGGRAPPLSSPLV
ncbi:MAG TPA: hypothetical protein VIJ27_00225 [Mucilaginibacter sp.]